MLHVLPTVCLIIWINTVTVSGLSCACFPVLFIVSTWCFLCAMCSPVYCLAPPILLSDYWCSQYALLIPLLLFPVFVVLCWFVCTSYLFLVFPSRLCKVFVPYLPVTKFPLHSNPRLKLILVSD